MIEVRKLVVADVFSVAKILAKATNEGIKALGDLKDASATEVGMAVVTVGLANAEKETKEWLASLIGKTAEEFETMPAGVLLDIVEALVEQEDIKDFFTRANVLAKKLAKKS